ncbi:hypothetical protein BpHYR1_035903 [Brachionus plicatilis]|uniref:Uncharacterized protein n=1 Tax=Brachionus plicatilis TaxID=10195 RepID=A0A3M7SI70_BRAPC|nr:hypothetical protein BpHYR1_035903 [Brachionus plicatilis]
MCGYKRLIVFFSYFNCYSGSNLRQACIQIAHGDIFFQQRTQASTGNFSNLPLTNVENLGVLSSRWTRCN